jgi:ferredoxin
MQDDKQGMQGQGGVGDKSQEGQGESVKKGKYTIKVIREKCIGAASCIAVAPNSYKLDEENIAVILGQKLDSDENLLLSAQSCPTAAIIVTDDETGEQVWPK